VEQYAYRVLAQLGLVQDKQYRWKGRESRPRSHRGAEGNE
jgi:hypothetical protein